ncbi:MAG TPA: hypothetical protein DEB39_05005 [Planctomycetaceae bacterium]|nr:hypothetical protein [Planctomycetaceae bacterium]
MKSTVRGLLWFVILSVSLALHAAEPAAEAAGKKFAVLVGVDDYVEFPRLQYTKNDTESLRDQLYEIGFEKQNVVTLTCGGAAKDLPTKNNIEAVIGGVLNLAREGDIVVIAMSGHGIEMGGEPSFCPMDAREDHLSTTTVPIKTVFEALERSKATYKLMIVDACRNNPFRSKNLGHGASVLQTIQNPPQGVMLLQSCARDEKSYEDDELRQGVFTHFLVEGLQGKAADKDGKVTFFGLFKYASEETQRRTLNQFRKIQRPYFQGEGADFVLATIEMRKPTRLPLPLPALAPSIPAGRRVDVSTASQLRYAVENAKSGDVIVLAPGTYGLNGIFETGHDKGVVTLYGDPVAPANVKIRISGPRGTIRGDKGTHLVLIGLDVANEWRGVYPANDSKVDIRFCNIHDCGDHGICASSDPGSFTGVVVENCVITGNSYGIFAEGSLDVRNCSIKNNRGHGISDYTRGCAMTVTHCDISRNEQDGILMSKADSFATVTDCVIRYNRRGIWAYNGAGGDFRDNTLSGNREDNWSVREASSFNFKRVGNTPNN